MTRKTETPEQTEKRRARQRAAQARYREAHPEKCLSPFARDPIKARQATDRHRAKNAEKIRKSSREWYRANKERHRAYREVNREAIAARAAAWRMRNPHKARAATAAYRAAVLKATPRWADGNEIAKVYSAAVSQKLEVDHVIPLRGEKVCGLHVHINLQLLGRKENARKGNTHAG